MARTSLFAHLLAGGLAAGCGTSTRPPVATPAPVATCAGAAGQVGDLLASGQDPRPPDEAVNQLIGLVRAACEGDAWSAEARACFTTMASPADADHCGTLLTDAQTQGLLRRQEAAAGVAPARGRAPDGAAGPPAGAPPPPAR